MTRVTQDKKTPDENEFEAAKKNIQDNMSLIEGNVSSACFFYYTLALSIAFTGGCLLNLTVSNSMYGRITFLGLAAISGGYTYCAAKNLRKIEKSNVTAINTIKKTIDSLPSLPQPNQKNGSAPTKEIG